MCVRVCAPPLISEFCNILTTQKTAKAEKLEVYGIQTSYFSTATSHFNRLPALPLPSVLLLLYPLSLALPPEPVPRARHTYFPWLLAMAWMRATVPHAFPTHCFMKYRFSETSWPSALIFSSSWALNSSSWKQRINIKDSKRKGSLLNEHCFSAKVLCSVQLSRS